MFIWLVHTNSSLDNNGIDFFSLTSQGFIIRQGDGRVRVYRRRNERYADCYILERDRFCGGGSVLVWAGIAHGFRTHLIVIKGNLNAQCHRDEILVRHVIPLFQNNSNITLFQHNNAASHTARDTVNFLGVNNIAFINDWPAKSPDLNSIGHFWDDLDQHVRRFPIPSSNVIQLRQASIQECSNIPQAKNQYTYTFYVPMMPGSRSC